MALFAKIISQISGTAFQGLFNLYQGNQIYTNKCVGEDLELYIKLTEISGTTVGSRDPSDVVAFPAIKVSYS